MEGFKRVALEHKVFKCTQACRFKILICLFFKNIRAVRDVGMISRFKFIIKRPPLKSIDELPASKTEFQSRRAA